MDAIIHSKTYNAKIGQNDHSNPYIESTTVLTDSYLDAIINGGCYNDNILIILHRWISD